MIALINDTVDGKKVAPPAQDDENDIPPSTPQDSMLAGGDEKSGRHVEVSADPLPMLKRGVQKGVSKVVQLFFHQPYQQQWAVFRAVLS